ncbi:MULTISPECIES: class II aldolase/adducin family protein [unclassified Caballeronia]|uniref:class II aldolase/adducin family protein n=1 Tax=unclassified Caballeronia TaxID=2646786 RepID=UPI002860AE4F|nr:MULTISPECIES: class II aldolase/adducin family protein [unclassified Caballeronia]MDR5773704.1 class II aldolase/adducin family protein [Caballeronia sp. LZ002]MDR5849139.1 class II aldolase/adducin family protein [Caballeronia sp. LZ003]
MAEADSATLVDIAEIAEIERFEQTGRIDLAAAHRAAVMHDLHEGIANHFSLSLPDPRGRFLVAPFGLHWSEVKASDFLTLDYDANRIAGEGVVEQSALCIHLPIHQADPVRHAAVLHTHMPYTTALTRLADQRLLPIGQAELLLLKHIAYDDEYTGLAYDNEEGRRLADRLGDKSILFLANHGVIVTGRSVSQAYDRLYLLERAARFQVLAYSTGKPLRLLSQEQQDKVHRQYTEAAKEGAAWSGKPYHVLHFEALKRLLDQRNPGYAL